MGEHGASGGVRLQGWQGSRFGAVSDAEEAPKLRWEAQEEYAKHPAEPLEINPSGSVERHDMAPAHSRTEPYGTAIAG